MRSDSTRNLLDLALENWNFIKEHRRLLYCPRTLRALISGEHPKPEHASLDNEQHKAQLRDKAVDFALYIQFMQSFEAYRVLSVDDRSTPCTSPDAGHDKEEGFVTSKSGPEKCLSADRSFRDLVHETFRCSLSTTVAAMDKMQMTDVEFLGITLMILFDPQRDGLSEVARKVLSDARNQLSTDWLDLYQKCGIHSGEERMGNSVLLLPVIYQNSHDHGQIYHMLRLFGSIEYDKLIDEISL